MSNTKNTITIHKTLSPENNTDLRSHVWLVEQLNFIWENHFTDVERLNTVTIQWVRVSRTRLGTITTRGNIITKNPAISEIRINSLLRHETVPTAVVWQTIAHELAHYAHGFCSPHPQKYSHPHRGNVVKKELYARNLHVVYNEAEQWLKTYWPKHVAHHAPKALQRKTRRTYARRKQVSLLSHLQRRFTGRRNLGR